MDTTRFTRGVLVAAAFAVAGGLAHAQAITGSKLTTVETNTVLNTEVENNGQQQVYGGNAYGTFVAIDNGGAQASWPLFGPATVPAGSSATGAPGYTAWTAGTPGPVSGTGTAADPWRLVTSNVLAGATGISVTQTDILVDPNEYFRTDITLTNSGASAQTVIVYRAMDCYLGADDDGFGMLSGNAVGCVRRDTAALPSNSTDPTQPISRVEQFIDLSGGARKELNNYDGIWDAIGDRREFSDTCVPNCNEFQDNGMGLSWRVTIPAGGSVTLSHNTLFSPDGVIPPDSNPNAPSSTVAVPADNPLALALGAGALLAFAVRRRQRKQA